MRIVKQITNQPFLNIKEVNDPAMACKSYQFAERKGVNSVAFVCYDKKKDKYLINNEATPPIGDFQLRAFGGSIDKSKKYEEIVQDEVKEEAGYNVGLDRITFVGEVFVSTQMNQYCFLYFVDVSDVEAEDREPENATEALSHPEWVTKEDIIAGIDWKAITILSKYENAKGI